MNFDVVHSDRCEHSTLRADKNFILIVQVNSVNYGSKMVLIIPSSQRVEKRVIKICQNPTLVHLSVPFGVRYFDS